MIVKASASATSRRLLMSHLLFVGVGSRPPRDDFLTKARSPSLKTMAIPDRAACYFCLEEGVDEEGKQPLVRDCSCRGDSAGFAHFSCLTTMSKRANRQMTETCFPLPSHGQRVTIVSNRSKVNRL